MKLVRFGDRRTGLVVDLEADPHIIDVIASVGALLPHDPISKWRTEWHFERRRRLGAAYRTLVSRQRRPPEANQSCAYGARSSAFSIADL